MAPDKDGLPWVKVTLRSEPRYIEAWELQLRRGAHRSIAASLLADLMPGSYPHRRPQPQLVLQRHQATEDNGLECSPYIQMSLLAVHGPAHSHVPARTEEVLRPALWRYAAELNRDFAAHAADVEYTPWQYA